MLIYLCSKYWTLGINNTNMCWLQVSNIINIAGAHVYERRFELNTDMILLLFTYHSLQYIRVFLWQIKSSPWYLGIFGNVCGPLCSRSISLQPINYLCSTWHKTGVMHFCSTLAHFATWQWATFDLFAECISFCSIQALCAAHMPIIQPICLHTYFEALFHHMGHHCSPRTLSTSAYLAVRSRLTMRTPFAAHMSFLL